jgi:serine protease AprX
MLQANPTLTPSDIGAVLAATATPMPGYQPYQVGAGYVDAFAATSVAKKTRSTGTCTTRSGKQVATLTTSETYDGTVGVGVADAGAAYHDVHPFQVGAKAIRVTVTIEWTTPQDLDLAVYDPSGALATSSGNFPGVTTETATKRDGDCSGSLPTGTWNADAVGYLTVAESYNGTVEVEYRVK